MNLTSVVVHMTVREVPGYDRFRRRRVPNGTRREDRALDSGGIHARSLDDPCGSRYGAGLGGIGCVRISGPEAFAIARALFVSNERIELPGDGRPRFGSSRLRRPVDRPRLPRRVPVAVLSPASRPLSFAARQPSVLDALTRAASCGGVAAGPGEFTYRALRRGRLDLAGRSRSRPDRGSHGLISAWRSRRSTGRCPAGWRRSSRLWSTRGARGRHRVR